MIANIRPSGQFLMEDFFYAGGLRGLLERIKPMLTLSSVTVAGSTLGENIAGAEVYNDDVIRTLDSPVSPSGADTHGSANHYGGHLYPCHFDYASSSAWSRITLPQGNTVHSELKKDRISRFIVGQRS